MVDVKKSSRTVFSIDSILASDGDRRRTSPSNDVARCSGHDVQRQSKFDATYDDNDDDEAVAFRLAAASRLLSSSTPLDLNPSTDRPSQRNQDEVWLRRLIVDVARQLTSSRSSSPGPTVDHSKSVTSDVSCLSYPDVRSPHRISADPIHDSSSRTDRVSPVSSSSPAVPGFVVEQRSDCRRRHSSDKTTGSPGSIRATPDAGNEDDASNADGTRNDATNYGNYATWIATVSRFLQSSLSSAHDNGDDILRLHRAQRCDASRQRSMPPLNRSRDSNSNDDATASMPTVGNASESCSSLANLDVSATNKLLNFVHCSKTRLTEIYNEMMGMTHFGRRLLPSELEMDRGSDGGSSRDGDLKVSSLTDDSRTATGREFDDRVDADSCKSEIQCSDDVMEVVDDRKEDRNRSQESPRKRSNVSECFSDVIMKRRLPSDGSATEHEQGWHFSRLQLGNSKA
jgi:hypothetical protein